MKLNCLINLAHSASSVEFKSYDKIKLVNINKYTISNVQFLSLSNLHLQDSWSLHEEIYISN